MTKKAVWLAAGILLLAGYFTWALLVGDRYQTLCQVHFWEASPSQISACKDVMSELENRK